MIVGSDIIEADIVRGKKDSPHVCQYLGAGWVLCLPWVRSKIQTRTGCFNIMNLIEYKHIGQLWMKRTWVCELMVQSQKQQQSHLERGLKWCYMSIYGHIWQKHLSSSCGMFATSWSHSKRQGCVANVRPNVNNVAAKGEQLLIVRIRAGLQNVADCTDNFS